MKVNFKSKTGNKIHVTLSINKVIAKKFKILFPNINLSKSVEDSMIDQIWNTNTQGLFAAVLSFWFGSRAMSKVMKDK